MVVEQEIYRSTVTRDRDGSQARSDRVDENAETLCRGNMKKNTILDNDQVSHHNLPRPVTVKSVGFIVEETPLNHVDITMNVYRTKEVKT